MIIAGIGCRKNAPSQDILALLTDTRITALATPVAKHTEPGLIAAAQHLNLPLLAITPEALAAAQPRCVTHSARAHAATGFSSIAEACALAAAGPTSRLIQPRTANATATCALAEGDGA